jgi:DNA repair exonuclease SbcCD ATPase subunit
MLAPTDSYDRMREAFEKRREEFSQRAEELDQAAQSAQEMAEKFGEEVDKVSEQIDAAIEKGKPTEALQARRNELLNKKDLARVAAHKAGVLREELTKQSDAQSVEGDRMWAEAEKVHSEIKLQLAELTRDAINRGIATKVK